MNDTARRIQDDVSEVAVCRRGRLAEKAGKCDIGKAWFRFCSSLNFRFNRLSAVWSGDYIPGISKEATSSTQRLAARNDRTCWWISSNTYTFRICPEQMTKKPHGYWCEHGEKRLFWFEYFYLRCSILTQNIPLYWNVSSSAFKRGKPCRKRYSNTSKWTTIGSVATAPTTTLVRKHLRHKKSLKQASVSAGQDHLTLSTPHRRFICIHLSGTHLTDSLRFSLTLTTTALNNSRLGWFGFRIWLPNPRGLPSSLLQQEFRNSLS